MQNVKTDRMQQFSNHISPNVTEMFDSSGLFSCKITKLRSHGYVMYLTIFFLVREVVNQKHFLNIFLNGFSEWLLFFFWSEAMGLWLKFILVTNWDLKLFSHEMGKLGKRENTQINHSSLQKNNPRVVFSSRHKKSLVHKKLLHGNHISIIFSSFKHSLGDFWRKKYTEFPMLRVQLEANVNEGLSSSLKCFIFGAYQ